MGSIHIKLSTFIIKALLMVALIAAVFVGLPLAYFMCRGWDYRIALPRGYELVRVYSGNVGICSSQTIEIIGPNIERYAVLGNVVVGYVTGLRQFEQVEKTGYFILDTKTSRVQTGLTEKQWLAHLKKAGISKKPRLKRPMRPINVSLTAGDSAKYFRGLMNPYSQSQSHARGSGKAMNTPASAPRVCRAG